MLSAAAERMTVGGERVPLSGNRMLSIRCSIVPKHPFEASVFLRKYRDAITPLAEELFMKDECASTLVVLDDCIKRIHGYIDDVDMQLPKHLTPDAVEEIDFKFYKPRGEIYLIHSRCALPAFTSLPDDCGCDTPVFDKDDLTTSTVSDEAENDLTCSSSSVTSLPKPLPPNESSHEAEVLEWGEDAQPREEEENDYSTIWYGKECGREEEGGEDNTSSSSSSASESSKDEEATRSSLPSKFLKKLKKQSSQPESPMLFTTTIITHVDSTSEVGRGGSGSGSRRTRISSSTSTSSPSRRVGVRVVGGGGGHRGGRSASAFRELLSLGEYVPTGKRVIAIRK